MCGYGDPKIAFKKVDACEHRTAQQCDDDARPALPIMKDREEKEGNRRRQKSPTSEGLETLDGIPPIKELFDESCPQYREQQNPGWKQIVFCGVRTARWQLEQLDEAESNGHGESHTNDCEKHPQAVFPIAGR